MRLTFDNDERWDRLLAERDDELDVCPCCLGSGVEYVDEGLPERCCLCKGRPNLKEAAGGPYPAAA